jgi:DNA modification methylase
MTVPNQSEPLIIDYVAIDQIKGDPRNARMHSEEQLARLEAGIRNLGFNNPLLLDENDIIIGGHARLAAARKLGFASLPCVRLRHLTATQKKALGIGLNRLSELATWDTDVLSQLLLELSEGDFDAELSGFSTAEMDALDCADINVDQADPDDDIAEVDREAPAITRLGDKWQLGRHVLLCANALETDSYIALLGEDRADLVFCDAPYGVPNAGHVTGLGKIKHREFVMGGKMSSQAFAAFLTCAFLNMAKFSVDGSIHYQCMDWRRLPEILEAGSTAYTELKNVCVWDKGSGGMGSLYRSQHELVLVFKKGKLGKFGRYRTNLWSYPGLNSFGADRDTALEMHPTVKPVGLVADAIRDCSKRGALVLDPFVGSGTTIIAAERTGRKAAAMELDPLYVDVAVRRWLATKGRSATLIADGRNFEEVAAARLAEAVDHAAEAGHG